MPILRHSFRGSLNKSKVAFGFTASLKNLFKICLPGIVIFNLFSLSSSLILKAIEVRAAVLYPAFSKILQAIFMVVDLPFVPVTPITFIF